MRRALLAVGLIVLVLCAMLAVAFTRGGEAARKDQALDQARVDSAANEATIETARHAANAAGAHGERRLELERESEDARRAIEAVGSEAMVEPALALAIVCNIQRVRHEPLDARCPARPDSADPG